MRIDFARLNHILIPKTKAERDRYRQGRIGRVVLPLLATWGSFTDEGRVLLLVTAVVGAISVDVQRTSAHVVFAILAGLLAGSLLASRGLRMDRTTVRVYAPRRVTIGDELTFRVTCRRDGHQGGPVSVRIRGPFLPWDGAWTKTAPEELILREAAETEMRARFIARGLHHLDPFEAAAVTPFGLTSGPQRASNGVKIHVVPRIANVVRLPLALATKHQPGGVALASKAGESMDLLGIRPYRPGDPVRDIHARSWARTGKPVVREYQQEYFTRVGVVLDTGTKDPDLLEAAIELAAGVIAKLSRGEALIDVLVVGDTVHELTMGRSLGGLDQALELLAAVETGPPLDAVKLVTRLEPHLAQLSSVIAITLGERSPERDRLEGELKRHGLATTSLVVDLKLARAIRAGEALSW